ncbi:MAG TPA: histidine kinase dimerization/phospho-acceptor domain-containing protein [Verrucomicrobiae bacterium]
MKKTPAPWFVENSALEQTVATLRTTQSQLVQSEKLSCTGEFIAGVAHELNDPLTSVIGFSELLQQSNVNEQHRNYLGLIVQSVQRCHKIVQNLLSFARRHTPERRRASLNALVQEAAEILHYQMHTSNIAVVTRLDPQLSEVMADPHQLQQVVLSPIYNARQTIEAHQRKGTVQVITLRINGGVRVVVQDDGPGISEETLSKILTRSSQRRASARARSWA